MFSLSSSIDRWNQARLAVHFSASLIKHVGKKSSANEVEGEVCHLFFPIRDIQGNQDKVECLWKKEAKNFVLEVPYDRSSTGEGESFSFEFT